MAEYPHIRKATALDPLAVSCTAPRWVSLTDSAIMLAGAGAPLLTFNNPAFFAFDDAWYRLMLSSRIPWLAPANRVLDFAVNAGMVIYCVLLLLALLPRLEGQLVHADSGAYPSWHVRATAAAVAVTAMVFGKLWIWISGAIPDMALTYSRTCPGAHWLSDTIPGAPLGRG